MGTRRLKKVVKKFNRSTSFLEFIKGNKKKIFWVFGLCFILILSGLSFWLLRYLFEHMPHFEKEPELPMSASITYQDLQIGWENYYGIEGFAVEVWKDGIFKELVYVDEFSEVNFGVTIDSLYQLKVSQGTKVTTFDVNMTTGANNVFHIDPIELDIWVYENGVPILNSYDLYIWDTTLDAWVLIGNIACETGTGHYRFGYLNGSHGTYGVMSPSVSDVYNFEVLQIDESPFTISIDVVDIPKNPKKSKNEKKKKNIIENPEELFPHTFF